MPSYGPWIQEPDYVATNEVKTFAGDWWRTEYAEIDGPYGTVLPGTYVLYSTDRNSQPATVSYTFEPSLGTTKFAMEWIQDEVGLFDPDGRSAIRKMREMYKVHSASPFTDGIVWFLPESVPAGAVGIEYEGADPSLLTPLWAPASVVGLSISGHMSAVFQDSLNTDDSTRLRPGSEFTSAIIADQGEAWDSDAVALEPTMFPDDDFTDQGEWDPTHTLGGPNLGELVGLVSGPVAEDYTGGGQSVDLTVPSGLLDPLGRVMLYTQMDFDTSEPLIAATEEPPAPPGITGILAYGYHLGTMTATWTLRPPRYRWLFEGSHPWRLFPRDDKLGNNPRIFPRPTTRQNRDRIFPADW